MQLMSGAGAVACLFLLRPSGGVATSGVLLSFTAGSGWGCFALLFHSYFALHSYVESLQHRYQWRLYTGHNGCEFWWTGDCCGSVAIVTCSQHSLRLLVPYDQVTTQCQVAVCCCEEARNGSTRVQSTASCKEC